MLKAMTLMFLVMAVLFVASPVYAQEVAGAAAGAGPNWVAITSGFAMAIASAVCGIGQAKATASACEALARNPSARPGIQLALILGLALIESLALYTLVIIFAKVV